MATGRNDPCPCGSGRKLDASCLALSRHAEEGQGYAPPSDFPARELGLARPE
ncbi:MAG TPA: SEC-C metal-binding domain-containing protein [Thermoanaerobaculia bacterium]|nr:SEC-C metal-binding domain-containing protein [Thermoanaerobaculia bacterium]HPA51420.1 SEC-C metal-binding domain-containing protein [Thermoanaerobaculia bacterium]HQN07367.1 SEC-C metal-binding domain-containing protein [Thermoanaerobaculia bacterium]HQP85410.1 SEC-C metal-binding domain-containing protein [Thermoanaerobaculia bacterium]